MSQQQRYNTLLVNFETYGFSTPRAAEFIQVFEIFDTEADACQAVLKGLCKLGYFDPKELCLHLLTLDAKTDELVPQYTVDEIQASLDAVKTTTELAEIILKYDHSNYNNLCWTYQIKLC